MGNAYIVIWIVVLTFDGPKLEITSENENFLGVEN